MSRQKKLDQMYLLTAAAVIQNIEVRNWMDKQVTEDDKGRVAISAPAVRSVLLEAGFLKLERWFDYHDFMIKYRELVENHSAV